jgi:hypothetical protein
VERSYKWREVTSGEKLQVERSYKWREVISFVVLA